MFSLELAVDLVVKIRFKPSCSRLKRNSLVSWLDELCSRFLATKYCQESDVM